MEGRNKADVILFIIFFFLKHPNNGLGVDKKYKKTKKKNEIYQENLN